MYFFGGASILFGAFFFLVFGIVLAGILYVLITGLRQWNRNNHAPRLTEEAVVVSKRTEIRSHHRRAGETGMHHATHSTRYYATFQVPGGGRMEFAVTGPEYGMLAEGDRGELCFQGTRYLGFARDQ